MRKSLRDNPVLVVKPSLVNALFPIFFNNFLGFALLSAGIFLLINIINILIVDFFIIRLSFMLILVFILAFSSILIKLIILRCTKYTFYKTNVIKEFKLIIIRRESVVYNRITNISLKISIWDRITGAGNITLHTGDDESPDVVLPFINNPISIEEMIYSLIQKKNVNVTHSIE